MSPDELESLAEEAMKFYTVNISSTGTEKPNIQKFTLQKISELVYKFVVSRPSRSATVYFNMLDETSTELFTIEEIVKIDDQYLCYFGRSQENKQLHKIPLGEYNEVYIENAFKYLLMNNSDFVDFVNSETSKNK